MSNQEIVEVNTSELDTEISMLSNDNLLAMAEQAERRIDAINRIMSASLKITNEKDWILIAGVPYLQETGATKVARLFGIGWSIENPICETDTDGHFTYTYKGKFFMGGTSIEATGSRSSRDEFFTGKTNPKAPQDIDKRDVKMSAYTNCINNGIKRILPGLRNLTVDDMAKAGSHSPVRCSTPSSDLRPRAKPAGRPPLLTCGRFSDKIGRTENSAFKIRIHERYENGNFFHR